ncbi:unnamed protein product [Prorocentrum cordatum]|uniref:Ribosome biogenesis protein NOP53 n=1 Tax=Prorocentrum cordatum TaxID=2364126 RepID=A0ABN9V564_9DINO|nr:unnamed protein product [Polarella glacialis]|mmetsp:Transcript_64124/g.181971  ORF Transcript_64124/g.181971 Transcript_64124/m.181971 type:complete len:150 (-) Transcript_64124:16-465(-)
MELAGLLRKRCALFEASEADQTRAGLALMGGPSAPAAADVAEGPTGPAKSPRAAGEAEVQDEGAAPPAARARTTRRGERAMAEDQGEQAMAEDQGESDDEGREGSPKFRPRTKAQRRRQQRQLARAPKASDVPRPNRLLSLIRQGFLQG